MDLLDIHNTLKELKLDNDGNIDYLNEYKDMLENKNILFDTHKVIDIFNDSINNSITKDNSIQKELDSINDKLNKLNNKFIFKRELCKQYINNYNSSKETNNKLFDFYNENIINLCKKNIEYNKMMNDLLEQYNNKFEDYDNQIKETYPKNFMVQIVVNMIILTDLKYKSNISLKELLLNEIEKQNMEIQETKKIIDSTHLNKLLMNECIDIKSLIGKLGNDSLIKIKEEAIENIINDIN
jgi:hypothetical protein